MVQQFINEILSKLNFFFSKTQSTIQLKPDVEKYKMPSTYISKIVQPMHFLDFIIMISTESKESKLLL